MRPAGDYRWRFTWEVHSYTAPSGEGDGVDVYAAGVSLWGDYDGDRITTTVPYIGSTSQESTLARLRFRNYPAIKALDVLTDSQSGEEWTVLGARRGDNETLVDAYLYR